MTSAPKMRLRFWHKLLLLMGSVMILLALGLTWAALAVINGAAAEIGTKGRQILATQTERFLDSTLTNQAEAIDLQMDRARITAINGATRVKNLLKVGILPSREQLASLLDHAGPHSTAVYYLSVTGQLTFDTLAERGTATVRPNHEAKKQHLPVFPASEGEGERIRWSAIHRNPFQAAYERVFDAVAPVYLGRELEGYLGVSLSVAQLAAQFNDHQAIQGSYTFLMDAKHRLVAAPPHAAVELTGTSLDSGSAEMRPLIDASRDNNFDAVLQEMVLGSRAVETVQIRGQAKYLAYRPLNQIDWRIGLAVPEVLATAASEQLVRVIGHHRDEILLRMLTTTLILLAVTLVVVGWLARHLTRPLQEMAKMARRVARGDLDQQLDLVRSDEIGALATAFNAMTRDLKQTLVDVKPSRRDVGEREGMRSDSRGTELDSAEIESAK